MGPTSNQLNAFSDTVTYITILSSTTERNKATCVEEVELAVRQKAVM